MKIFAKFFNKTSQTVFQPEMGGTMMAKDAGISMSFSKFAEPCYIHADRTRVKQVLINLLSNAIKYSFKSGVVQVKAEETEEGRLRVSVIDQGQGIKPEHLSKLFGKKAEAVASPLTPPPASPPPPDAPKTMKAWDAYGRIVEIPRENWRTKVLPGNFRSVWNQPEKLATLINVTLNDGFIADCLEPARHLHRTDPQPKRGATFLAAILLQLKNFDEAEK